MPSRNKADLNPILTGIYNQAIVIYSQRYPTLPQPFITCTYRSNEEQAELYAQGRTKKGGVVTWAKPGESKHNKLPSDAFDIAFIGTNKKLDWSTKHFGLFAGIVKEISSNVTWGGDWKTKPDAPHFEIKA